MKKRIRFLMMLCLVLAMAFASPQRILAAEDGNTVLVLKGREPSADGEIEIDVIVEENTGVCSMLLSLEYDTSVLTLTDLEYGSALSSLSPIHTNTNTEDGYGIYPFRISYLGEDNDASTGTMMTLRFRVHDHAPEGSYLITFTYERDKAVSYLKDGQILTKNLLIDGAKITLSADQGVKIETYPDDQRQEIPVSKSTVIWAAAAIGASTLAAGCIVLMTVRNKHNKQRKWTKI